MWISNNDKEVECFHPVCKKALEAALKQLGLTDKYIIQHHRYVGSIEMDLVIANKINNKVLCVVEVKRTISAVNSTRYQYQAMSYVQSLSDAEVEKPFYMLTNLEASCLFKYDSKRKNVYEQILEPGIEQNHLFTEVSEDIFKQDLISQYKGYITTMLNDSGVYLISFRQFANKIAETKDNALQWQKTLATLFYEYIRGSFSRIGRKELKSIGQLSQKIDLVCNEGLKINFKDIFTIPNLKGRDRNVDTDHSLIEQLFDLGRTYVDADELASVMHRVVSHGHEHEGEVPTDAELANVLLWLVKTIGGGLRQNDVIMDPAAGGGSLVCAAIDIFDNIIPSQIIANDINPLLLQLLSLRIGLRFASTITPNNTVTILNQNIAYLDSSVFDSVKYIVMNPPFLAATGKRCLERKNELYRRIRAIKHTEPITLKGQMPLEGVFIELITNLAMDGTVIGAIIPNTHLTTKGEASVAIRNILLEDFGLQLIFSYPQENLFEGVSQNTSIVIGIKGSHLPNVKYLHCNNAISDIDASNIGEILRLPFTEGKLKSLNNDFDGCNMSRDKLRETLESGWMIGNIIQQEARNFLNNNLNSLGVMERIETSEFNNFQRGKIGNQGCTDLMFLKNKSKFKKQEFKLLAHHLSGGLNNAKFNGYDVGDGECMFLDAKTMDDIELKKVISDFIMEKSESGKKQRKDKKSADDYFRIIKESAAYTTQPNSVILPRSIRSTGRVFITSQPTYVSTNFFIFETTDEKAKILSSWMSTVFFQLECEAYGNNRKGLRKMEKGDYKQLHVPVISRLSDGVKEKIMHVDVLPFLNLRQPQPRPADQVWAQILFGDKSDAVLEEAKSLLAMLAAAREQ